MLRIHKIASLVILVVFLVSGCAGDYPGVTPTPTMEGTYPLDSRFNPLLEKLGDLVGVGISPSFLFGGAYYQYTTTVLLVYAPEAAPKDRYRLFPLGYEWFIRDPEVADPGNHEKVYVNGHIVWDEVVPYYTRMGADITGLPLTEVYYNAEKSRFEQLFENMGFYRNENDGLGSVKLMPYGQWKCSGECNYPKLEEFIPRNFEPVSPGVYGEAEARFLDVVSRMGAEFTGARLGQIIQAEDGYIEQAFENLVMIWNPERPDELVNLRRLPQLVGITPEPPVPPSNVTGMYFYGVSGELGYNIPQQFMDYITMHGTLEFSGTPITEAHRIDGGSVRQCFEKLCLVYDPKAPVSLKIRPADLGHDYVRKGLRSPGQDSANPAPAGSRLVSQMKLSIWEEYPLLDSGDPQVIGAAIFDGTSPLNGVQFSVTVFMPDNTQRTYLMPLTGNNGQSAVVLDEITAPKGTIVLYEVCVTNLTAQPVCMEENFLIWDNE